jgi:hypothetical protein
VPFLPCLDGLAAIANEAMRDCRLSTANRIRQVSVGLLISSRPASRAYFAWTYRAYEPTLEIRRTACLHILPVGWANGAHNGRVNILIRCADLCDSPSQLLDGQVCCNRRDISHYHPV